jgi:hypothetical protein
MEEAESAMPTLAALKAVGVQLALMILELLIRASAIYENSHWMP